MSAPRPSPAVFAAVVEDLAAGFPLPPAAGFATAVDLARYQAGLMMIEILLREVSFYPSWPVSL